jgi:lysozyme family protein
MAYEWPKCYGDLWPVGFDQLAYDGVVNSGPGRGVKWVCQGLGFANDNPATVKQAAARAHALDTDGKIAAARAAAAVRMSFLRGLRDWPTFGKGWGGRVMRMEAIAVKMILEASALPKAEQTKRLEREAAAAKATSGKAAAGGVVASGGGAAGANASETVAGFDWTAWLCAGGIVLIVVGGCIWIWFKHRARAKAYLAAARGLIGG